MRLESRPELNFLMSAVLSAVGFLLIWLGRSYDNYSSNEFAGFTLGWFLLGIGVIGLISAETRSIELDELNQRVILEIRWRRAKRRKIIITFNEIRNVTILRQGNRTDGSVYYDLGLVRRDGTTIYLFGGCAFDGRMSREWINGLKETFDRAIGKTAA